MVQELRHLLAFRVVIFKFQHQKMVAITGKFRLVVLKILVILKTLLTRLFHFTLLLWFQVQKPML